MEFRKMTMTMLADFCAISNGSLLQFWRDEAQRGLERGKSDREPGAIQFFTDAIECIDAEAAKRARACVVPAAVLEMLRHMSDEMLVKTRTMMEKTTVPPHDEQRAARTGNFIKAINNELAARAMARNREGSTSLRWPHRTDEPKPDGFDEFATRVPEDLRHFFTEKVAPEGPTRNPGREDQARYHAEQAGIKPDVKPGAGMVFTLDELSYLCLSVAEFEHHEEAVEKTVGVPLYQRLQQIRQLLADLLST